LTVENAVCTSELGRMFCSDEGACVRFGKRRTGFRQSGRDRSTILARARFQPCYCHLHEVQTGHPSPSAHQFRLLLNDLATSALRRMFLQLTPPKGQ
jgi:hypothetical protein